MLKIQNYFFFDGILTCRRSFHCFYLSYAKKNRRFFRGFLWFCFSGRQKWKQFNPVSFYLSFLSYLLINYLLILTYLLAYVSILFYFLSGRFLVVPAKKKRADHAGFRCPTASWQTCLSGGLAGGPDCKILRLRPQRWPGPSLADRKFPKMNLLNLIN